MKMSVNEFQRRVFNTVLSECYSQLYLKVIGDKIQNETDVSRLSAYAEHAKETFAEEMNLENRTMTNIIESINKTGSSFAKTLVSVAESVSCSRKEAAKNKEIDIDTAPKGLNEFEQQIVDDVFKQKLSDANIEEVRDSISQSILLEKAKTEEIKDAMELDKARSKDGTISESVINMTKKNPTTLLEAIYKFNMNEAYDQLEDASMIDEVIPKNKEIIREGSQNIYAIYETIAKFGFRQYSENDVEKLIKEYTR